MGRRIWSSSNVARFVKDHDPSIGEVERTSSPNPFESSSPQESIPTWAKIPFDIDEPLRDDHVYEAFVEPGHSSSSDSFPERLPSHESAEASMSRAGDCPESVIQEGLEPPVTPSSGVFHSHTLPLTLPTVRGRISPSPSSTTVSRPEVRLAPPPHRRSQLLRILSLNPDTSSSIDLPMQF